MKSLNTLLENHVDTIPPEFLAAIHSGGVLEIQRRYRGAPSARVFLFLWLAVWGLFCLFMQNNYIESVSLGGGSQKSFWMLVCLWGAELYGFSALIYMLFCREFYLIDKSTLRIEKSLFGFKTTKFFKLPSILSFSQIKEEGDGSGKYTFPVWHLTVTAGKTEKILSGPYEHSCWLGQILADWAHVGFTMASEKKVHKHAPIEKNRFGFLPLDQGYKYSEKISERELKEDQELFAALVAKKSSDWTDKDWELYAQLAYLDPQYLPQKKRRKVLAKQ